MSLEGTGLLATTTLGASIGLADPSLTLAGPLSAGWPTSGLVHLNIGDTEELAGTISGTTVTITARAVEKINTFSTAQPHAPGDRVTLIASWAAMQNVFSGKADEAILQSNQASITFPFLVSAIPQTGRTLRIRYQARDSSATNGQDFLFMQLNGDTGATQYAGTRLGVSTTTVTAQDQAGSSQLNVGIVLGGASSANCASAGEIVIPNYSGAVFFKQIHATSGSTFSTHDMDLFAGIWQSPAPVTSVRLFPQNGNFIGPGCVFSLYIDP